MPAGIFSKSACNTDAAAVCLSCPAVLCYVLQELTLTSISTVRLGLPPPPCMQPQQQLEPVAAVPFAPPRPFVPMAFAVSSLPVLPTLQSLVMDGNFGVSDDLLASLLAHAPQLSSLNLVLAGENFMRWRWRSALYVNTI